MKKAFLTRRMTFAAAHRLNCEGLPEAENQRIFGKCNHAHGHGHNYTVEVTVHGDIHPMTGMVMNLTELKAIMVEVIEKLLDHKNLNVDVPAFKRLNPTAENIAVVIWDMIEERASVKGLLHEVKIIETENNFASYRGS